MGVHYDQPEKNEFVELPSYSELAGQRSWKMHLIRIVTIGDTGSGKTALLRRYRTNDFNPKECSGRSCEYKASSVVIDKQKVKLQIWDFSGQEKYRTTSKVMYERTHGVVLMFSVADEESFLSLPKWLEDIKRNASSGCKVVLCANKTDLPKKEWKVSRGEFSKFAADNSLHLFETSASTGRNADVFMKFAIPVYRLMASKVIHENIRLYIFQRRSKVLIILHNSFFVHAGVNAVD